MPGAPHEKPADLLWPPAAEVHGGTCGQILSYRPESPLVKWSDTATAAVSLPKTPSLILRSPSPEAKFPSAKSSKAKHIIPLSISSNSEASAPFSFIFLKLNVLDQAESSSFLMAKQKTYKIESSNEEESAQAAQHCYRNEEPEDHISLPISSSLTQLSPAQSLSSPPLARIQSS
ncbi:hypothetical protein B7463_g4959, partial [Scytalidium lignicola]